MGFSLLKYIPLISSIVNGFIIKTKHDIKVKSFDQTKEKIDTMEHLLIKLDKKMNDTRHEIEELRKQVICSRVLNIIFFVCLIVLIIIFR